MEVNSISIFVYDIIIGNMRLVMIFICLVLSFFAVPVGALDLQEGESEARCDGCQNTISKAQEGVIATHCEEIREHLKTVQKNDARTRVYLGSKYETILSKFIMPLNVRLVENNLSNAELVENQNDFAGTKKVFNDDYINYQQGLEELVLMDCKNEPAGFYEKLTKVRQKRKIVEQDVLKLRSLMTKHINIVMEIRNKV